MGKKYLFDVIAIRLSLIFLLVFYHAFAIYTGNWKIPYDNFPSNDIYYWLGHWSHGFRLEAMTFISGLLFGYTLIKHPERLNYNSCILKKAKRLLLPCIIFSVVYYLMFYDLSEDWYIIAYKIVNGCGHLWYLPMIFWCFVVCYLLESRFTPPIC